MNRFLAFEFIRYGLLLAGIGLLVHQKAPDYGWVTRVAGGAVSLMWGCVVRLPAAVVDGVGFGSSGLHAVVASRHGLDATGGGVMERHPCVPLLLGSPC